MNVAINSSIYRQASDYAQSQGLDLTEVIETFLIRFIGKGKKATEREEGNACSDASGLEQARVKAMAAEMEQPVPDIVLSLLGAGVPVADDDLNARKAYNEYLEEKYQ